MSNGYYNNSKRVMIDGVPCKVASWVGELGNDKEFLAATRPAHLKFKKAYYEGGIRMIVGGIPVRMSAHIKGWKASTKAMLLKGSSTSKEQDEIKAQMEILFPAEELQRAA